MFFFTSSGDLKQWVLRQENADSAAERIIGAVDGKNEQDIVQACRNIFDGENIELSEKVLFSILGKYGLVKTREGSIMKDKIIKKAQMMRQDSVYGDMDMRVCPKLPHSVGKRLISTYNCRHYCLDSIVMDDDPKRVYCAEALWRRHVMDKFSREFKDKDGKWVGGYINERFQVAQDDGGNQMQLPHGCRTRLPRPHQYSTERRLEENRGNKTHDLFAGCNKMVRIASSANGKTENDDVHEIFSDIIDMKEAKIDDNEIIEKVAGYYGKSEDEVRNVFKMAMSMLQRHDRTLYACNSNFKKKAFVDLVEKSTMVSVKDIPVVDEDGREIMLRNNTPSVVVSNGIDPVFQIADGEDAGKKFKLKNPAEYLSSFEVIDDGTIQDTAEEVGLL